jgi:hypothetical protein
MNYWGGVICGCCVASLFFVVMMFVQVEQTNRLREEVVQLREEVADHERIMRAYEFYNWQYTLKMEKETNK